MAVFDLLKKSELYTGDTRRIKQVAVELLRNLKAEKLNIDPLREKEGGRDAVHTAIGDFLWSDETGLPLASFSDEDVNEKTEAFF